MDGEHNGLTKAVTAIAAAKAWQQAEAEGLTQRHGGDRKSSSENPNLIREPGKHFAAMFGVSADYAYMARHLLDRAPELAAAVEAGEIGLSQAYREATAG